MAAKDKVLGGSDAGLPVANVLPVTRFVLVHGDKGGVGKSTTAAVLADTLMTSGVKVAIIDADTRNPDVIRMFQEADCPRIALNLRAADGWMDAMDFVHQHPGHTFVLSMPAGIGESMQTEFQDFVRFLKSFDTGGRKVELVMWWVINLFADSINLLSRALTVHQGQFDQLVVVRNLAFGPPEQFILWDESPLKSELEKKGALTVNLPPLHLRVMKKLMNPDTVMPFSMAMDPAVCDQAGFLPSEAFKLRSWFEVDVPEGLGRALGRLKAA